VLRFKYWKNFSGHRYLKNEIEDGKGILISLFFKKGKKIVGVNLKA